MATAKSFEEIPLADAYADNDIKVPNTYKKAVSRVIEEQLKAYYEGTRSPVVKAFHKWYDNARCFNKIVDNYFNRVVSDCLTGPPEGRSDYQLTEEGLYLDFKNHLAELAKRCNEDDEEVPLDSEEDDSDVPAPDTYTEAVDSVIEELSKAYFDGERTPSVVAFQNWYWDGHLQKIAADNLKRVVTDCLDGKYGGKAVCQLSKEELCNAFKQYIADLAENTRYNENNDRSSADTEQTMEGSQEEESNIVESDEDADLFIPDTYRRAVDRVIEELSQAYADGNQGPVVLAFQKWCEEGKFHKIAVGNFRRILNECESGKHRGRSVFQLYEEELYDGFKEYIIELAEGKNEDDEMILDSDVEEEPFEVPAAYKRAVNRVIKKLLQAYSGGERTPVVTVVHKWSVDGQYLDKIATYYFRRVVVDSFSGQFNGKSVYELSDAEIYPGFKAYITGLAEKFHEDSNINIDNEGSDIPVPDMYKRAVDKVIDELLQAYANGERTPVVTAVHEWQSDPQELENVKNDNFKRVLNDYLGGKKPPTEDELYNGFKEYVTYLAEGFNEMNNKESIDQIQIQVPEVYRKAASRVVDAFLHAYRKGDRSRAVRAFNKWHDDYKTYDKIMTDTYKYVVSENQAGSAEGKIVLQMPENILYRKIMKRVTQLSVGFTDDYDEKSVDSEDEIPVPENYKKAVTKATDEYLQSYFDGNRSVKVKAFYQWYSDNDIMEDIVNDCFKQMIKRCLNGPIGGQTAYEMSENDLYLEFKNYINKLVENMDEEDTRSLERIGDYVLSNKFSRVISKVSGQEEIPIPETFKRAVARATTDMLQAYADGERARMVTAFRKWYRNDKMFEDVISDSFRSCVESCLDAPVGGKTVYDMSERELYDGFKAFVFELADETYEDRGSECSLFESDNEEEVPEDETEDEDSEIEIKKTGFSLKRILSCLCPWARCFKSRKKHKNKVRPTQSERFNMIFSRVTARNM